MPAVAPKLEPGGKHDACFLPRSLHVTGDIQIHEMVYRGDELWFANTAFSCLCTYDNDHSFVPRWRPPFVTELTPEDRCHLNGLGCGFPDLINDDPKITGSSFVLPDAALTAVPEALRSEQAASPDQRSVDPGT